VQPEPVAVSQTISDVPTLVSNWICGYGFPVGLERPEQSATLVFMKPFAALAVMVPAW
jgi:hypothetical protein